MQSVNDLDVAMQDVDAARKQMLQMEMQIEQLQTQVQQLQQSPPSSPEQDLSSAEPSPEKLQQKQPLSPRVQQKEQQEQTSLQQLSLQMQQLQLLLQQNQVHQLGEAQQMQQQQLQQMMQQMMLQLQLQGQQAPLPTQEQQQQQQLLQLQQEMDEILDDQRGPVARRTSPAMKPILPPSLPLGKLSRNTSPELAVPLKLSLMTATPRGEHGAEQPNDPSLATPRDQVIHMETPRSTIPYVPPTPNNPTSTLTPVVLPSPAPSPSMSQAYASPPHPLNHTEHREQLLAETMYSPTRRNLEFEPPSLASRRGSHPEELAMPSAAGPADSDTLNGSPVKADRVDSRTKMWVSESTDAVVQRSARRSSGGLRSRCPAAHFYVMTGLRSVANSPPRKMCCAAACCGMLQAVGGGNLIFQKASKVANRHIKHKRMHLLTPCKDGHNIIISCMVKLLLLLVTFPLFVHFIDIHDCQMAQCLITLIETIVC